MLQEAKSPQIFSGEATSILTVEASSAQVPNVYLLAFEHVLTQDSHKQAK
jgi:hypothetical protein